MKLPQPIFRSAFAPTRDKRGRISARPASLHALLPAPCTPHPGSHSSCSYPQCSSHVPCTQGTAAAPCTADGPRGSCADIWSHQVTGQDLHGFGSRNGKKQEMETKSIKMPLRCSVKGAGLQLHWDQTAAPTVQHKASPPASAKGCKCGPCPKSPFPALLSRQQRAAVASSAALWHEQCQTSTQRHREGPFRQRLRAPTALTHHSGAHELLQPL